MPKPPARSYRLYGAIQAEKPQFEADFQAAFPRGWELPDLLRSDSGQAVRDAAQWLLRRPEVHRHTVPLAYGEIPASPTRTVGVDLHSAVIKGLGGARLITLRVEADGRHAFLLRVFVPDRLGPLPVVLNGDACWHYATDEVITEVLRRAYVFAQFNRVEIAADVVKNNAAATSVATPGISGQPGKLGGSGESGPAAIACWAWAYHRAVDALLGCEFVDARAIAVVGHSRGGKAALLAGATDERIALTSANNSGAGGAGCFRWRAAGAEKLADLLDNFPHWLNPALQEFAGRENALPFDQHFLKALIAPRALLTTEALGDLWANPSGAWQTHLAAQKVYEVLGAKEQIAIAYRDGAHAHTFADWCCFLDFADTCFVGIKALPAPPPGSTTHTMSGGRV